MVFVATYYRQFSYMASTNYGFDRQYSIHIPLEGIKPRVLADEVAALKGVQRVGFTSQPLGFRVDRTRISPGAGGEFVDACYFRVDHNFVRNMNLKVAAGGNMPLTLGDTVSRFVLVNEKAVQSLRLGSPGEAVGKTIWLLDSTEAQIAGVLKDFNYENLSQPIRPLLMQYDPAGFRYLNAKVDEKADGTIMADLERVWKKLSPYKAVQLQWFDEQFYTQHFHLDDQMVLAVLTLMAITIAGLGLLGMVTYTTALRTKEVGIRKVLGASVGSIVALLSRSFLLLLLVAGLIALPLGYTAGSLFLQSFAFHVSLGAGTLLCCLGIMLAVGGLAVGIQTYRAAAANPVNALQSE
jgi:putative ABC transport system permease protein